MIPPKRTERQKLLDASKAAKNPPTTRQLRFAQGLFDDDDFDTIIDEDDGNFPEKEDENTVDKVAEEYESIITTITEGDESRIDDAITNGWVITRKNKKSKDTATTLKHRLRKEAKVFVPSKVAREWAVMEEMKKTAKRLFSEEFIMCGISKREKGGRGKELLFSYL